MEYKYSTVITPSEYEAAGLCDGIDLRKHNHTYLEDRGCIRAQHDWTKYNRPVSRYRGALGPEYSILSVTIPECIPERLEIISFANEFAFLHDDITDIVSHEIGELENNEMMEAFYEGARAGAINITTSDTRLAGKKQMQSTILREMLAIDRECALVTMKAWAKFVEVGSSRQHNKVFTSMDEYLPYRIVDVGEMFWFGLVTFAMGLKIPEEEIEMSKTFMRSAWIVLSLTNDLYSWPKEYEAAVQKGQSHVVNAIWVLMHENSLNADEAKTLCRKMIKEYVSEYIQMVKELRHNESLSLDLRKYLDAMQYTISGNAVWSLACPRYNKHVSFNKRQLEWMDGGLPEEAELGMECEMSSHSHTSQASSRSISSEQLSHSSRTSTGISSSTEEREEISNIYHLVLDQSLPDLSSKVVLAPFDYLCSLPSKGVRSEFVNALNHWLQVPKEVVEKIKMVATLLHNSSLLLDDFQDSSLLRRGKPATHTIFGPAQTINTASYCIVKAIGHIRTLEDPSCLDFAVEKLLTLFTGQSFDLHWTYNTTCPSISQYLQMIDSKTGALFQLLSRLMLINATTRTHVHLDTLSTLFGRFFQIRDDYQNLVSADYANQKGFTEDLDEGKYSLPLLHLLHAEPENMQIRNILSTRRALGKLTQEQKILVLESMKRANSLVYTRTVLRHLHKEIGCEIQVLEKACNSDNVQLKMMWEMLYV